MSQEKELKKVNSTVVLKATASLNRSVVEDFKSEDKDIKELLDENTKRDDTRTSAGNNPDSIKKNEE